TANHKVTIFYNPDKHAHDQNAIKLVNDPTEEPPYDILGETTYPGLNTPNVTSKIYTLRIQMAAKHHMGENWLDVYKKLLNITIAHELGHGVNLPDHTGVLACIMSAKANLDNLDAQTDYCELCKKIFLLYLSY
ncbi:MAG: hypothetical protein ACPLSK_04330, partial [bacterium]